MARLQIPPDPHRVIGASAGYTHRQARGTWEPGLALQEQWERLRGWGLLGPCSSLLQPLPDSGSPLPVLSPQQALTLTPGVPTGPGSPLAPVRPWGIKKVDQ